MRTALRLAKPSVVRSLLLSGCALGLVATSWYAYAERTTTLRIERNGEGSIVQTIAVKSWSFEAEQGVLRVTSTQGDRQCVGSLTAPADDDKRLVLDGVSYLVESINIKTRGQRTLVVRPTSRGLFPVCASASAAPAQQKVVAKGLGTGLNFQIDALTTSGFVADRSVGVAGAIDYDLPNRMISLTTTEDILCLQSASVSGLTLAVTDTNGQTQALSGLSEIAYFPFTAAGVMARTLAVRTGADQLCVEIPTQAETVMQTPTAGGGFDCNTLEGIFSGGFEDTGMGSSLADLQIDLRLTQSPNATTNTPARYQIHVQNCGIDTASDVLVRDFFPAGAASPSLAFGNDMSTWDCVPAAACTGGNGYIEHTIANIDPGQTVVLEASRALASGTTGQAVRVTAAAVVLDGADNNPSNNVKSWQFHVLSNEAPQANVSAAGCAIDEDAGTIELVGGGGGCTVTVTGTDSDGTMQAINITSQNPGLLAIGSTAISLSPNSKTATLTQLEIVTQADQFGTATLDVVAVDNLGGMSAAMPLTVVVNPVNDPPDFTILGDFVYPDSGTVGAADFRTTCNTNGAPLGCADQSYPATVGFQTVTVDGFLTGISGGGSGLESETVDIDVSTASPPANFFAGGNAPGAMPMIDANGRLQFSLSGASGTAQVTVTADDQQASNNISTMTFDITVENAPPAITINGTPDRVDEDATDAPLAGMGSSFSIEVEDDEGDHITDVIVTSKDTSLVKNSGISVDFPAMSSMLVAEVKVSPEANAFGTVQLDIVAKDVNGNTSASTTIDVIIEPVNDPPVITVLGGFDYNGGSPIFAGPNCTSAACAAQTYTAAEIGVSGGFSPLFQNWVVSVEPGPANEAGQGQPSLVISNLTSSAIFFPPSAPKLSQDGSSWDLTYGLNATVGMTSVTITADDGQAQNSTATLTFDIIVN